MEMRAVARDGYTYSIRRQSGYSWGMSSRQAKEEHEYAKSRIKKELNPWRDAQNAKNERLYIEGKINKTQYQKRRKEIHDRYYTLLGHRTNKLFAKENGLIYTRAKTR